MSTEQDTLETASLLIYMDHGNTLDMQTLLLNLAKIPDVPPGGHIYKYGAISQQIFWSSIIVLIS